MSNEANEIPRQVSRRRFVKIAGITAAVGTSAGVVVIFIMICLGKIAAVVC